MAGITTLISLLGVNTSVQAGTRDVAFSISNSVREVSESLNKAFKMVVGETNMKYIEFLRQKAKELPETLTIKLKRII